MTALAYRNHYHLRLGRTLDELFERDQAAALRLRLRTLVTGASPA
jgi:hypothetical protein